MLLHSVNVKKPLVFFCKMDFKKGDPASNYVQEKGGSASCSRANHPYPTISDNAAYVESTCKVASAHPKWAAHKQPQALNQKNNPKHKEKAESLNFHQSKSLNLKKHNQKTDKTKTAKNLRQNNREISAKKPKVSVF